MLNANEYSYAYYDALYVDRLHGAGDIQIPADSSFGGGIGGRVEPGHGCPLWRMGLPGLIQWAENQL